MAIKVGINGFGRIGRNVLRASLKDPNLDFVAVNDLTDPKTLAHLLKYDSVLGNLPNQVSAGADSITVDGKTINVFKEKDPAALPWESVGAQVVIESTGRFTDADDANKKIKLLYVACGDADTLYDINNTFHTTLEKMKVKHVWNVVPGGGHTFPVWRNDLYLFSQMLFKEKKRAPG